MNKKLFLKLGLSTLVVASSLSFIACGEKDTINGVITPPTLNINESNNTTENSVPENEQTTDSSEVAKQNSEEKVNQKAENLKAEANEKTESSTTKVENSKPKVEQTTENEKPKTDENLENTDKKPNQSSEEYYYNTIKNAMQRQIDYINSIEDPAIKQSVQSSIGAATNEATLLELQNPEDSEIINIALQKVLNGK